MALDFSLANGQNRQSILGSVLEGRQRMRTNQARDLLQQAAQNPEQRPELLSQALALAPRAAATAQGFYHNQAVDRQNAELLANKQQQMAAAQQADVHKQRLTNLHGIYEGIIQTAKMANRKGKDGLGMMDAYFQQVRPDLVKLVGEVGGDPSKIPMHYDKRMMPHFLAGYTKTGAAIGKDTVPGGNELRGNRFVTTRPGQVIFDKATGKPVFTNTNPQFAPRRGTSSGGAASSVGGGGNSGGGVRGIPSGYLTNAADSLITEMTLQGVKMPSSIVGRSTEARTRLANALAKNIKASGMSFRQAVSNMKASGTATAGLKAAQRQYRNISAAEGGALGMVPIIKKLSDQVDRATAVPLINSPIQAGKVNISGDPATTKFVNAVKEFSSDYAKVISGNTGAGGASVAATKKAESMLSAAMTKGQFDAQLDAMVALMHARTGGMQDDIARQLAEIATTAHKGSDKSRKEKASGAKPSSSSPKAKRSSKPKLSAAAQDALKRYGG